MVELTKNLRHNMNIDNSEVVSVPNSTVEFRKGNVGSVVTYIFDTTKEGHPMVNAMAGLAVLKDDEQLIMINHCAPSGLFPKIAQEFDYAYQDLPSGLTQVVFSRKSQVENSTDFSATSCGGGCG